MPYFVYILRCADDTLYTGITTNVQRRFDEHRSGVGAKYTRAHKPVKVIYIKRTTTRSIAQKREAAIKKMTRGEKLALIAVSKK